MLSCSFVKFALLAFRYGKMFLFVPKIWLLLKLLFSLLDMAFAIYVYAI